MNQVKMNQVMAEGGYVEMGGSGVRVGGGPDEWSSGIRSPQGS